MEAQSQVQMGNMFIYIIQKFMKIMHYMEDLYPELVEIIFILLILRVMAIQQSTVLFYIQLQEAIMYL